MAAHPALSFRRGHDGGVRRMVLHPGLQLRLGRRRGDHLHHRRRHPHRRRAGRRHEALGAQGIQPGAGRARGVHGPVRGVLGLRARARGLEHLPHPGAHGGRGLHRRAVAAGHPHVHGAAGAAGLAAGRSPGPEPADQRLHGPRLRRRLQRGHLPLLEGAPRRALRGAAAPHCGVPPPHAAPQRPRRHRGPQGAQSPRRRQPGAL
mmetsp:Transcript_12426/g.37339  ORF Transcript_12426/g.37339 Transcript_12426/m.37339 type:complete len:205 (+) Transcript_12426:824-1438(+)